MSLLNNNLSVLMNQRLKWLSMRAQVLVDNVANADNKSATRKEVRPFKEIVGNNPRRKNFSQSSPAPSLSLSQQDIIKTKTEITRETEMLEMAHNSTEHEAIILMVRNFHKIFRTILNRK